MVLCGWRQAWCWPLAQLRELEATRRAGVDICKQWPTVPHPRTDIMNKLWSENGLSVMDMGICFLLNGSDGELHSGNAIELNRVLQRSLLTRTV